MPAGVIGKGIRIKGTLRAGEDLIVHGAVEGTISLADHHLTLETSSRIRAELAVKEATIKGAMQGNSEASSKVTIDADAIVRGDIKTPVLVIEDGARFRGAIDMDVPLPADLLPASEGTTPTMTATATAPPQKTPPQATTTAPQNGSPAGGPRRN